VEDQRHGVLLDPRADRPVRVTVRHGSIENVTLLETGDAGNPALCFTTEEPFDGPAVGFAGETFTVSNVGPAQ